MLCILGTIFVFFPIFSPVVLRKFLQIFDGDDRKSMSGNCFSILVNYEPLSLRICLILPHMLGLDSGTFP
jgi:hypothetical protein